MENFQSGWMYRIAAEVAIEILVLLDHSHVHALSSEQIAEHHACWSATNNTTRRMNRLVCHGCSQCKATCNFSTKPDLNSGDVDRIRTCIRVYSGDVDRILKTLRPGRDEGHHWPRPFFPHRKNFAHS